MGCMPEMRVLAWERVSSSDETQQQSLSARFC
jgi:hypothetical protein